MTDGLDIFKMHVGWSWRNNREEGAEGREVRRFRDRVTVEVGELVEGGVGRH